jgi:phospholipase A1
MRLRYPGYRKTARYSRLWSGFLLLWLCLLPADGLAVSPGGMAACVKIDDDAARLRCYDRQAGRQSAESAPESGPVEKTTMGKSAASYLSRLWELDSESRRGKFAISPHHANYILPFTSNNSPNLDPIREADPTKDLKKEEVAFQLSLKVKLWEDIFGKEADLWMGYTQRSFWQLYNFNDSSPFRETN